MEKGGSIKRQKAKRQKIPSQSGGIEWLPSAARSIKSLLVPPLGGVKNRTEARRKRDQLSNLRLKIHLSCPSCASTNQFPSTNSSHSSFLPKHHHHSSQRYTISRFHNTTFPSDRREQSSKWLPLSVSTWAPPTLAWVCSARTGTISPSPPRLSSANSAPSRTETDPSSQMRNHCQ